MSLQTFTNLDFKNSYSLLLESIIQDTADKLCKQIVDGVDESMMIIIMVTDNMAYLVETEDGKIHLHKKDKCKHHVDDPGRTGSGLADWEDNAEASTSPSAAKEKQKDPPDPSAQVCVPAMLPGRGALHQQEGTGTSWPPCWGCGGS